MAKLKEIRKSNFIIRVDDLEKDIVKIKLVKNKIEYYIYRTKICKDKEIELLKIELWAIILCKKKHVLRSDYSALEIKGIRYTEEALQQYLEKTKKLKRILYNLKINKEN